MPDDVRKYLSDYPELLSEWDYSKNIGLDPQKIIHRTKKVKAWWKCSEGHEWQALVANRTYGSGCPICAISPSVQKRNTQRIASAGSLASENPQLAKEWHPAKNGDLLPSNVTPSSNRKVWWLCSAGHEWQAAVAWRNKRGTNCPYCSGRFVISGVSDLATTNPMLAAEWHPTKNGNLTPSDVKAGSNKKAWWKCSNGHEWEAVINARKWGNGCPICDQDRRGKERLNNNGR